MANPFLKILKDPEIRTKLLYTVFAIIIFRILAAIPTPGLEREALKSLFENSTFGKILSLVTGNVLENASIIAIGLGPYINASVIIQLLASVIPSLEALQEEGTTGQRKLNQYTRVLTVPLAIIQSFVIYSILTKGGGALTVEALPPADLIIMILTLTAGAMILMWFGEIITEGTLSNGVSLIIAAGILAGIPGAVFSNLKYLDQVEQIIVYAGIIVMVILIIVVNEAQRKVNVQYASRVRGGASTGGQSFLPLKLNQAGVMPVIFAISFLSMPALLAQLFSGPTFPENIRNIALSLSFFSDQTSAFHIIFQFVLIIAFSLFYMFVVFKPEKVADNLKKQGGFIPGIRPGKSTEEYLTKIMWRLGAIGGAFLALVSLAPIIFSNYVSVAQLGFTGTGLIIVISVVLDIRRKVESMIVTKSYSEYN